VGSRVSGSLDIVAFLRRLEAGRCDEFVHAFFFGEDERLAWSETIAEGRTRRVDVDYRELIGLALRVNAGGLILAHNHPSGVARPSPRDVTSTLDLQRVCKKMKIDLLDHLIVTTAACFSFRAEGLL
jgi:DNA repair protein RadC